MQIVAGAVKSLADITVTDLHTMKIREMNHLVKILPIVIENVKGELRSRNDIGKLLQ